MIIVQTFLAGSFAIPHHPTSRCGGWWLGATASKKYPFHIFGQPPSWRNCGSKNLAQNSLRGALRVLQNGLCRNATSLDPFVQPSWGNLTRKHPKVPNCIQHDFGGGSLSKYKVWCFTCKKNIYERNWICVLFRNYFRNLKQIVKNAYSFPCLLHCLRKKLLNFTNSFVGKRREEFSSDKKMLRRNTQKIVFFW